MAETDVFVINPDFSTKAKIENVVDLKNMRLIVKIMLLTGGLAIATVVVMLFQYAGDSENSLLSRIIYVRPCDTPLTYRLGSINLKFDLSQNEAKKSLKQAAEIWGKEYGKDIFVESPTGELAVNFIYDKRQELRIQMEDQISSVNTEQNSLEIRIENYKTKAADFNRRAAQLNKDIDDWNRRGGAPQEIYDNLRQKVAHMRKESENLSQEAQDLKNEAQKLGKSVETLNGTVTSYNDLLSTKPEEGLYNPEDQTISIYMVNTQEELISILAHEFGHAIGMNHLEDQKSIMYKFSNGNLKPTKQDKAELSNACQKQNRFKNMLAYLVLSIRSHLPVS